MKNSSVLKTAKKGLLIGVVSLIMALFQNCAPGFQTINETNSGTITESSESPLKKQGHSVKRLSNLEYKNSIVDAVQYQYARVGDVTSVNDFKNSVKSGELAAALSALPGDFPAAKMGTDQMSSDISESRFSAYLSVANVAAANLTADSAKFKSFAGCNVEPNDFSNTTCINNFIVKFGTILFRTPPKVDSQNGIDEVEDLKKNAGSWKALIARMFIHPRFLTHYQRDGKLSKDGSTYTLTAYEVSAKLASIFWKSVPDLTGIQAAESGAILTDAGLRQEVSRMLDDPRAKAVMWNFYQQWFSASGLPPNYGTSNLFAAFSGDYSAYLQTGNNQKLYRTAILEEAEDFLNYLTFTQESKLEALFRSPLMFATLPKLAEVYGSTARANRVAAPYVDRSGKHSGILSRAFITNQRPSVNGETNHILRGVFVLTNLAGIDLGQPANFGEQEAAGAQVTPQMSTREETQIKTSSSSCIGCHATINPSGFAFAKYDSLGRFNTIETRYKDVNGVATPRATNSIDSTAVLRLNGTSYTVSDIPSLVTALFSSGRIYEGFAKYYFRFAFGRLEKTEHDYAIINSMKNSLKTKTIKTVLRETALLPEFRVTKAPGTAGGEN